MPGQHDRLVGQGCKCGKTLVHLAHIGAWKISAPASFEEQCVARNETSSREKALAAGGVPGSVDAGDRQVAHHDHVSRLVRHEVALGNTRGLQHPWRLVHVHMNRYMVSFEQGSDTLDGVTHH